MSDEKEKAPIHPAVALNDPRGGLYIVDGEDAVPVHSDDMTDEVRASYGLPAREQPPATDPADVVQPAEVTEEDSTDGR